MEIGFEEEVMAMMQEEKVKKALDAVNDACGKCKNCSPDCPLAISRRALQGLLYDLQIMKENG